ncbi:MAG: SLC5 family protein, partial [Planctomycetaceae bacterium]
MGSNVGDVLTPLDLVIFFGALLGAMLVGVIAGRRENTSEDYFLAGRGLPWWAVAGSIFGSNVSAEHLVGMMGIGFSIGFAQSHFELGAIAGLMVLCYGFLPVYRKLRVYTLSEYLGRRYDNRSRVCYSVIMIIMMAGVQMVPALYIGSRTICVLLGGDAVVEVADGTIAAEPVDVAGAAPSRTRFIVNSRYYAGFVIALGVIAASYTVFGGLKAVVWTDAVQSFLLLAAGLVVAGLTFQRIGGWGAMMAIDQAADGADKMSLYLPMGHPQLPWTGAFTGLMAMHFFYWGTNQFIVQRALGARSDAEGRAGIVAAGFLKLLIPFFSIGAGVAAFYLFRTELPHQTIDPDTAFSELVKLVVPVGTGVVGLI